jgi:hypothetical protein
MDMRMQNLTFSRSIIEHLLRFLLTIAAGPGANITRGLEIGII